MTQAALREQVQRRASDRCEYCLCPASHGSSDYAVDHVMPQVRGGANTEDNLAWSCAGCNNRKFTAVEAEDPLTGETAALYHPRRDEWKKHFKWDVDRVTLIGLTAVGRATTARLQLNRPGIINQRKLLMAFGLHPPEDEP